MYINICMYIYTNIYIYTYLCISSMRTGSLKIHMVLITPNRLILKVGVTKSVRTLYKDCALTSMRSQNDWKVPRKLIHVTNHVTIISISTEKNQISQSVYP